jgi:hypothetical protein
MKLLQSENHTENYTITPKSRTISSCKPAHKVKRNGKSASTASEKLEIEQTRVPYDVYLYNEPREWATE